MPRISLWPSSRFGLSVANETPLRECNAVPSPSVLLLSASSSGWVSSSTSDRYGCDLEFGDHSCAVTLAQDGIVPASVYSRTWELRELPLGREKIAPANAHQVALSNQIGSVTPALCTTKAIESCPLWVLSYQLYQLQQGPET